jgi:hypothetical protein
MKDCVAPDIRVAPDASSGLRATRAMSMKMSRVASRRGADEVSAPTQAKMWRRDE